MSTVEIIADSPISIAAEADDTIVLIAESEVASIAVGEQGPPGPQGPQGAQGVPGIPGPAGPQGAQGNTVLYGTTDPSPTTGDNGDFYINTTTNFIFGPKATVWPAGTSLVGPQGPQGIQGQQGIQGPQGVQGVPGADGNTVLYGPADPTAGQGVNGNFYINTTTHFMFGPKAGGAWPAGTSLIGPQGPQGPQGIPGTSGIADAPNDGVTYGRRSLAWTSLDAAMVRYDIAQSLTAAQQQQGRQNIYAAPFDALAFNGLQINGSMDISQQWGLAGTALTSGSGSYVMDGNWLAGFTSATAAMVAGQNNSGPPGFSNQLYLRASTPGPFSGAGDFAHSFIMIEGGRIARLGWGTPQAQPLTIGFMVSSIVAGTMAVALRNGAANRSIVTDVTINSPGLWEYHTVTFPGDTTGTWPTDNSVGLTVFFTWAAGSSWRAAAPNVWNTGDFRATPSTINFFATTNNQCSITGVVVLPGNEAPTQTRLPFIMRPPSSELALCQRYYEGASGVMRDQGTSGSYKSLYVQWATQKRAAPTVSLTNITYGGGANSGIASNATLTGAEVLFNSATAGGYMFFTLIGDARF